MHLSGKEPKPSAIYYAKMECQKADADDALAVVSLAPAEAVLGAKKRTRRFMALGTINQRHNWDKSG